VRIVQPVALASTRAQTIADIARLAGVSKSTVSRALNDSPLIGAETKERVRAIAREHRFQLNVPARRLSLKRSNTVALVMYRYGPNIDFPDAFMLELMSGISVGLHASEHDLLVIHVASDDVEWPRRYFETGRVDGFILLSAMCTEQHLAELAALGAPFIVWGVPPGTDTCCSVSGDSFAGGRLATSHLLRTGRRRIAFLGGPAKAPEVQDRYRGYEAALHAAGEAVDPALVAHASWHRPENGGAAAMRGLLEVDPALDAVFANSDLLALAAMDAIRASGRRVPEDVAVVGYDDVTLARHGNPPLTTIRQDGPLAGRLLAQNLIQHIETGAVTNVAIPAELVVRESA
jgi:DNA-binding LacI/PurR family transcriptional regulator